MTATHGHGLIYRWVWGYRALMRLLYGPGYISKYQAVVDLIPSGASVVDLCAGDCVVAPLLKAKGCAYVALDLNEGFVSWAKNRDIDARLWDGVHDAIPESDVVCMQSSLYHFMDGDRVLLQRMASAARKMVIISEPVHNISTEGASFFQLMARKLTVIGGREHSQRYTADSLDALLKNLPGVRVRLVSQGRDVVYVLEKDGAL